MKLVEVAIKRPVTIWMFVLAVMLFGLVSLSRLAVNLLPDLSYPTLTIRTDYDGAAPQEVEMLISKPIEEAVGVVKNVRQVHSISKAGQSDVVLEFNWGTDMDMASLNVREKLDIIQLPLDIKKPVLLRFNPSLDPIMRFALTNNSETMNLKQVRIFAEEQIKRNLESTTGVASVQVGGGLEQEIHVEIDPFKLNHHQITLQHVLNRLRQENINMAGGRVKDVSQDYFVRTINQFQNLDEIRDLIIKQNQLNIVRLSDVATVTDSHKERDSITQINGEESIEIALYKEGDANSVKVSQLVQAQLKPINKRLPEGLKLTAVYDQAQFIESAVSEVKTAGVIGGLLAMFVLFLFLRNSWTTFIVSLSIPVSVIATFNFMNANGISLNIMSLGGIALAIGLLVDSTIVVLENIARHKEQGAAPKLAALLGTKEVAMAVTASTLTTMAVFFPLAFVEGIAGQLFSDQALAITFALLASLIVSLTLIPMLASRERREMEFSPEVAPREKSGKPTHRLSLFFWYLTWPVRNLFLLVFYWLPLSIVTIGKVVVRGLLKAAGVFFQPIAFGFNWGYDKLANSYNRFLARVIKTPLAVIFSITLLSLGSIPLAKQLGSELLPPMAQGEFYVDILMPTGTKLDVTEQTLTKLSSHITDHPAVEKTYSVIGTGSLMNASPGQSGDNWGRLNVVLNKGSSKLDEQSVISLLREKMATMPGFTSKIDRPQLLTFKAPIQVILSSYELDTLATYSERLVNRFNESDLLTDINPTLKSGNPEVALDFNHTRLAQLGLTAATVSDVVATQVGGTVATKLSIGDRKVDILVRTEEEHRNSVNALGQLIINPDANQAVTLEDVADITITTGPSEINRLQQERVAIIDVNVLTDDLSTAVKEVEQIIVQSNLPLNITWSIDGQNEDMERSFDSLMFALALAVFMVYIVMASQFESLLHPLLILFTVPLAGAGSVYGLYLTGTNLSVVVFIGLIMLAGIVVNNAIVLIDRINQLRAQGVEKLDAIQSSAKSRLRPIVMTTLTTTLGLLPLVIGSGDGAEMRTPMALTVIFGLLYATVLTLLFIPCLYALLDQKVFTPETTPEKAKPEQTSPELSTVES